MLHVDVLLGANLQASEPLVENIDVLSRRVVSGDLACVVFLLVLASLRFHGRSRSFLSFALCLGRLRSLLLCILQLLVLHHIGAVALVLRGLIEQIRRVVFSACERVLDSARRLALRIEALDVLPRLPRKLIKVCRLPLDTRFPCLSRLRRIAGCAGGVPVGPLQVTKLPHPLVDLVGRRPGGSLAR